MDKPELETLDYKPKQPTTSPWEAVDKLEALSEQPAKSSRATEENLTPIIEPETKGKNNESVGQPICLRCKEPNCHCRTILLKELDQEYSKLEESEIPIEDINLEQPERRNGHNKLVYDKESRTIIAVDPHPEQPNALKGIPLKIHPIKKIEQVPNKPLEHRSTCAFLKHPYADCTCKPEQPNTELLIVKTIQGLMSAVSNQLGGLEVIATTGSTTNKLRLVRKALEDIDLFEKTTLFELQKAFE